MKSVHIICVLVAIVVLFFLLNQVSMYTSDGNKGMTCTCTSGSDTAETPTPTVDTTSGSMMQDGTMYGSMMQDETMFDGMLGN